MLWFYSDFNIYHISPPYVCYIVKVELSFSFQMCLLPQDWFELHDVQVTEFDIMLIRMPRESFLD